MPTPSQQSINHSNYVTLREYIDSRLNATDKALELARESMDRRLDTMNEFRASLKDQASTFVPCTEYNAWKKAIDEDIRSLRDSRSMLAGKAAQSTVTVVALFTVANLVLAILSLALSLR